MTGKRHLWFAVFVIIAGLSLYCGTDKGSEPDNGGTMFGVELETFSSSFDDPQLSEIEIRKLACGNASNDTSVYGLDVPGEWVRVPVEIPESGTYVPHLRYAAKEGDLISIRLEMDGCGSATVASFLLDEGTGTS